MSEGRSDHRIMSCPHCGDVNLISLEGLLADTPLDCPTCGEFMGTWGDLADPPKGQGPEDGGSSSLH